MNEYQNMRRLKVGSDDDECGICYFIPVCEHCNQFVKPYDEITFDGDCQPLRPNATCKKCGETSMIFEGYY
jgi:hypothetical protein